MRLSALLQWIMRVIFQEIAEAIRQIIEYPAEAKQMGKNGRRGVEERYNWGMEEKKLLGLYEKMWPSKL